jgi:FixJ family two-component response regulator
MSGPKVIALVDDDVAIREALQDLLRSCGYETRAFSSAEHFLAECQIGTVGCIVLDMKMPGMSGLELQAHLLSAGGAPPIVFMTSHADSQMRSAAMRAGAHAFLEKPVDDHVLIERLQSAMS